MRTFFIQVIVLNFFAKIWLCHQLHSTCHAETIFLIGVKDLEPISRFNQLPTVLLRFNFFLQEKNSVRNARQSTVEEYILVWKKAVIPIRLLKHCIDKLEKSHSKWHHDSLNTPKKLLTIERSSWQ